MALAPPEVEAYLKWAKTLHIADYYTDLGRKNRARWSGSRPDLGRKNRGRRGVLPPEGVDNYVESGGKRCVSPIFTPKLPFEEIDGGRITLTCGYYVLLVCRGEYDLGRIIYFLHFCFSFRLVSRLIRLSV